jgi:ABC-type amino acid transport system permease subunit
MIELFRGVSILVLLYFGFYALPQISVTYLQSPLACSYLACSYLASCTPRTAPKSIGAR